MKTIARAKIQFDTDTQMRDGIDGDTVNDYRDAMASGAAFPPLVVFFDGSVYWLADGYHRWHAAAEAGIESLRCEVRQGSKRDAILFACGANSTNGKRRTNADKHRAVATLLKDAEWVTWSDGAIADKCGVSQQFVSKLRGQLTTVVSSTAKRKGKDGKSRKPKAKRKPTPSEPVVFDPVEDDPVEPVDEVLLPKEPREANVIGEFKKLWESWSAADRRKIRLWILEETGVT